MGLYSRDHMIATMRERIGEMSKALEVCRIKPEHLVIHAQVEEFDLDFVREAFDWIEQIYHRVFYKWREVRDLCKEEIWETYEAIGDQDDLREMVMLREVNKDFRAAIVSKGRAGLFKKGPLNEQLEKLLPTEEARADGAPPRKREKQQKAAGRTAGQDEGAGRNHRQSKRRNGGNGGGSQRAPGEGDHHA